MKKIFATLLFAFLITNLFSQQTELKGKIINNENGDVLFAVNIFVLETQEGTVSDINGDYSILLDKGLYHIEISYLGFVKQTKEIILNGEDKYELDFLLKENPQIIACPIIYTTPLVEVNANTIAHNTPVTETKLRTTDIEKNNLGQDVPYLLSKSPSLVTTSDAGAGVGYTGMRIRGSDATRINVTINGIPLNDTESQGVFWVNLPDFASSANSISIRRGVGPSTNGASDFGATINLETNHIQTKPFGKISASLGSFDTWKSAVSFGSGLLKDKFSISGRLSKIHSGGYIDRAESNLNSYYISASFLPNIKSSFKINIFSGHEITYQAWNGVPQTFVNDEKLRTFNSAGTEKYGSPHEDEVDNYRQTHYHAFYNRNLTRRILLTSALHYTKGKGYFEQYKSSQNLLAYGITPPTFGDTTILNSNLIRRRWLDNDFYGAILGLQYEKNAFHIKLGGGWNKYDGKHFGEVIWSEYAGNSEINTRYYDNDAQKIDANIYLRSNYVFKEKWNAFADFQIRSLTYDFLGLDNDGESVNQDDNLLFYNPKAGLAYNNKRNHAHLSLGIANKEPNRNDYTESSPESRPKSERLYNLELNYSKKIQSSSFTANYYLMYYKNQLALNGQINDVGEYSRINIDKSYRTGLELDANIGLYHVGLPNSLILNINTTLSQNKISSFTEYVDSWDTGLQEKVEHINTDISFSPNFIVGGELRFIPILNNSHNLELALLGKYVGKQFIDNTSSDERSLAAYFTNDVRLSYQLNNVGLKSIRATFLVQNVWNSMFSSNAWSYRFESINYDPTPDDPYVTASNKANNYNMIGLYPQAGINFLAGISIEF